MMKSSLLAFCLLVCLVMTDVVSGFAMTSTSSTSPQLQLHSSTTTTSPLFVTTTTSSNAIDKHNALEHLRQQEAAATPSNKTESLITEITSIPNFVSFLNQGDSLCIVKVYANKCRLCQRFSLLFQGLARKHQLGGGHNHDSNNHRTHTHTRTPTPRFGSIQYGLNRHLCKGLGIQSLPTVLIYSQGTLIDQFACGPKHQWPELTSKILYLQNLSLEELQQYESTTNEGTTAIK